MILISFPISKYFILSFFSVNDFKDRQIYPDYCNNVVPKHTLSCHKDEQFKGRWSLFQYHIKIEQFLTTEHVHSVDLSEVAILHKSAKQKNVFTFFTSH